MAADRSRGRKADGPSRKALPFRRGRRPCEKPLLSGKWDAFRGRAHVYGSLLGVSRARLFKFHSQLLQRLFLQS